MLATGQCEIALIPVIEYQRIPDLKIIPEIAVASKSRVRSVLIASRQPLEKIRRITLDTSSRTSQSLVKILFARRFGVQPVFTERTPDAVSNYENMLESSDAALVIGDPAMRLAISANQLGVKIFDLAEEWRALTGLPFVFAVWAVRNDAAYDPVALTDDFLTAKHEGLQMREQIASQYSGELNMPLDDLHEYLRENVNYDLDEENILGLSRYFDLAYECGLIPPPRQIEFLKHEKRIEVAAI